MFSWLLEVVNSGVVSDIVSGNSKADAIVSTKPSLLAMFLIGIFVGIIISIIAFTLLHCVLHTDNDHNQEDE